MSEEIVAKADGNPLFLEQLALHAGEARDLRSELMVPDTIHDVVMARIDRLAGRDETAPANRRRDRSGILPRLLSEVWNDPRIARKPAARIGPSRIHLRAHRGRGNQLTSFGMR